VSPRLPSGALLGLTAAMTAATALVAALPARAGLAAPGGSARARARTAAQVQTGGIRDREWWLANLHVPQAWQFSRGAGVTVAVLSSGVEAAHPDLAGSIVTGPDLTGSGEAAGAPSWGIEGTSAASIIAGHGDNVDHASGIIGIAPGARILSIRVVLDATDPLNASAADVRPLPTAIAAGIRYAVGHGAQVINLPLDPASLASDGAATGGLSAAAGGSAAERAAVSYALGKGVVLVAPTGDNGEDGNEPTFPAAYPGVIALGAVDRHFVRAAFSIRQPYVALTAPGVNLTTASPPSGYRNMSTTDAASAIVAGVAALIRSRYPALTGSQVRRALLAGSVARPPSATAPGDGAGTVDALKAVQAAALIAAPRTSASAPSTSPATAQAPPGKTGPPAGHPRAGVLDRATTVLRDAAMAAGMLIVLLLASLVGIRIRRRRSDRGGLPAPEPRTLLSAPSEPLATVGGARHTRAPAAAAAPVAPMAPPGAAPWRTGPATRMVLPGAPPALTSGAPPRILPAPGAPSFSGAAPGAEPPGGSRRRKTQNRGRNGGRYAVSSRISAHGLRMRVAPAPRTVTRAQVSAPGGPPWEPAPMPEGGAAHEMARRVPDPFAPFAPHTPAAPGAPAPWEAAPPAPELSPPRHRRGPPGPEAGAPGTGAPGTGAPGRTDVTGPLPAGAPPLALPTPPRGPGSPPGPVPPARPAHPAVPWNPAGPVPLSGPPSLEGRLPLARPSSFAGSSGPPGPARPAVPPPAQPETSRASGQPGSPAHPPGAGVSPTPPPEPPGSGRPRPRPPYAGRHTSGSGPQPAMPGPPTEPGDAPGPRPGDAPSGPLYIWNPAALTEPFPLAPPPGEAERPGKGTEETENPPP